MAECTRRVTRPSEGRAWSGFVQNRSLQSLGLINRRERNTAHDIRLVQKFRLPLVNEKKGLDDRSSPLWRSISARAEISMIVSFLLFKTINCPRNSHNRDHEFCELSYMTGRLCSLDSTHAHIMSTLKMMCVRKLETLGSQNPAKGLVHRSQGAKNA